MADVEVTNLGLDIDGVITISPSFFAELSAQVKAKGGQVYIVSSRSDLPEVRAETMKELALLGITYDHLYLLPPIQTAQVVCTHDELDWYQKYIWQKVNYCIASGITCFYDDEEKVVSLFRRWAPQIHIIHYT
jgi:hypothetical protein